MRPLILALLLVLAAPLARAASNPDAIAVIIGNKAYQNAPEIAFADRDADAMQRYVVDVLGYDPANVILVQNASLGRMIGLFGTAANPGGQLARRLGATAADSDVFVYFSGHGFPGLHDHKGYLLPVDADARNAEDTGYGMDLLTANLGKLGARSVTLVLDACFSGDSAAGPLLKDKSVLVRPAAPPPAEPHVTVLAAAASDEMANWDRQDRHGAFTEFFLRAVYGAADDPAYGGKHDGRITAGVVKRYLDKQMSRWTARELDSVQTASLSGDAGTLLATFPPGHQPKRADLAPPAAAAPPAAPAPVAAAPVAPAPVAPAPVAAAPPRPAAPAQLATNAPATVPAPAAIMQPAPASAAIRQARAALLGVWRGHYLCGQGETGAEVSFTEMSDAGEVRGVFRFFNLPGHSNALPGAYYVAGRYDVASHALRMEPTAWIQQPPGYIALAVLFPNVLASANSLSGGFPTMAACTFVEVVRSTPAAAAAAAAQSTTAQSGPTAAMLQQVRAALLGVWRGHYVCAQGETGAEMSFANMTDAGEVRGVFRFFNLPGHSNALPGAYYVAGRFDFVSGQLRLDPTSWIEQPPGYIALPVLFPAVSSTSLNGGFPTEPSCTFITLSR